MEFKNVTKKQIDMIKHAYGFDTSNPGFRTHYCTEVNNKDMKALVKAGYFKGPKGLGEVGHNCGMFYVTDAAKTILVEMKNNSKKKAPPKKTTFKP